MGASTMPQIEPVEVPNDFDRIVKQLQAKIAELPPIDCDALHAELAGLAVPSPVVCTLQSINDDIGKIAKNCDRATEIYLQTYKQSYVMDTVASLLTEGWVKFSREKSEANRKGEARLKTAQFAERSMDVAILLKAADKISRSLENKYRMLVSQKECQERMLRMNEFHQSGGSYQERGFETVEEVKLSHTNPNSELEGAGDIFDTPATIRAAQAGEKPGSVV